MYAEQSNTGAGAQQNVNVEGDESSVYVGMRDVHVHHGREDFFRLTLDALRMESAPRDTGEMVRALGTQRLLVLGGGYDDKATVARQVARRFAEVHARGNGTGNGPLPVLEWLRGSDLPALLRELRRQTEHAVMLLPGIQPSDVSHDLAAVRTAAAQAGHHVLVTTDVPHASWWLDDLEAPLWYDLRPERMFDAALLERELAYWLGVSAARDAVEHAHDPVRCTVAGVPLRELAGWLGTPPNVLAFVQQLASRLERGTVEPDEVRGLAQEVCRRDTRVEKWFHVVLTPHEQLLALSLGFFDGLFDDQFFGALERWVEHVRERRDPHLRAFDYCDLENLRIFFDQVEARSTGTRIESRSPQLRAILFRSAWRTHRRQILSALGVLTELVIQSAYGRGNDWELYGSWGRRSQLRRVVGEALSDLGVISESGVERALLRLAADGNAAVQEVAARAVARWRHFERDRELFRLLDRWQKDARIRAIVESLVEGRDEKVRSPDANVRATVALAVGFAVEYDPPGRLTAPLVALLRELADDGHPAVRRRFVGGTLPRAVALHLTQLRDLLRDLAGLGYEEQIAAALAYAARTRPDEVGAALAAWHAECGARRTDTVDPRRIAVRERLLRMLAYTYGELDYDGGRPLSAEAGFQRLKEMLAQEGHPAVRDAVVDAVIRQARERFARVEPLLQQLMGEVTPAERDDVVRRLVGVYLDQRDRLEGANAEVEVGGRSFPAFAGTARPLTEVERAMMRWMRDPRHPAAQRIGPRASVAFVEALDGPESQQLAEITARRQQAGLPAADYRIASTPVRWGDPQPGWYAGTFVPWLATLGEPQYRPVIGGLLPEALEQNTMRPGALNFALDRWLQMRGDAPASITAQRLRSAISWHSSAWVLIFFAGFLLIMLMLVMAAASS